LHRERIDRAAHLGASWLVEQQHESGGWPTFYRVLGDWPANEIGVDGTVRALRALAVWRAAWHSDERKRAPIDPANLVDRIGAALDRGWQYLTSQQRADGSFVPLWFGNEHQPDKMNPVVGTAQVLVAGAMAGELQSEISQRAVRWLLSAQHAGGGWGPPRAPVDYSDTEKDGFRTWRANEAMAKLCSVEETALATTALLPLCESVPAVANAVSSGLTWLVNAIEQDAHRRPSVIGFYPGKIWYDERMYPLVFAAGALSRAARHLETQRATAVFVP
jgi:squalene-hopene/tetraprenyl-beta-curcumene cyclase